MLYFNQENGRAVLDATHLLLIPEFRRLQRKLTPEMTSRVFTFIHAIAKVDPKAPFFTADDAEIVALAKRNYFTEEYPYPNEVQDKITAALNAYLKAYETPEARVLKLFNSKIDQLSTMIKDTTPKIEENTNPTTGAITFSSNVDILTKAMEKIDSLMVTKSKLEAKLRNESDGKGVVRGGKKPSKLERDQQKG